MFRFLFFSLLMVQMVSSLAQDSIPNTRLKPGAILKDRSGRIIFDGKYRINYDLDKGGAPVRTYLDDQFNMVRREPITTSAFLGNTQEPVGFNRKPTWSFAQMGTQIGSRGLAAADFDGDGAREILLTSNAGQAMWQIVEHEGINYQFSHLGGLYGNEPALEKVLLNSDAAGTNRIVVVTQPESHNYDVWQVDMLDPVTKAVSQSFTVEASQYLYDMILADVNNDQIADVVTRHSGGISIFDGAAPHSLIQNIDIEANGELVIANFDNDNDMELAFEGNNNRGYVINCTTGETEWDYALGFGTHLAAGDIDGDGKNELVSGRSWSTLRAFDVDQKIQKWEVSVESSLGDILLHDYNRNGRDEIFVAGAQWGRITAHRGSDGDIKWSINNPDYNLYDMIIDDVDSDGRDEIIFGSDQLHVVDTGTLEFDWSSQYSSGSLSPLTVADLDGDNRQEIIAATTEGSDYDSGNDGTVYYFDGLTKNQDFKSNNLPGVEFERIVSLTSGDVDDDGAEELVILYDDYNGLAQVYNGVNFALQRTLQPEDDGGAYVKAVIADVDGDGRTELILGRRAVYSSHRPVVEVRNGTSMALEWTSPSLGDNVSIYDIMVANVDSDSNMEIIIATGYQGVLIFDGQTHQLEHDLSHNIRSLAMYDYNNDGRDDLFIGGTGGSNESNLFVYDTQSWEPLAETFAFDNSLVGLKPGDFNNDGILEILISTDREMVIIDAQTWQILWNSDFFAYGISSYNSIQVKDIDADGRVEFVTGSQAATMVFEPIFCTALSVSSEITDMAACLNQPVTLEVASSGSNLNYQWMHNATPIPGANSAAFTFSPASTSESGAYVCRVTDECNNSISSDPVDLVVYEAPSITQQPTNTAVCRGETAILQATATGSSLFYQWYHNGQAMPGETNSVLNLGVADMNHNGSYHLEIMSACSLVTSQMVELIVSVCNLDEAYNSWRNQDMPFCGTRGADILTFVASVNNNGNCPSGLK